MIESLHTNTKNHGEHQPKDIDLNHHSLYQDCVQYVHNMCLQKKNSYDAKPLNVEFPDYLQQCNELCCYYIYNYLTAPLSQCELDEISLDAHKLALNVSQQHHKLYDYMLDYLEHHDFLSRSGTHLTFKKIMHSQHKAHNQFIELNSKYPMFAGTLSLLKHCVSHYPEVLAEKIPAISVLYPEGNVHFLNQCYDNNSADYTQMPIIRNMALSMLMNIHNRSTLKILEIGGGRGLFSIEFFNLLSNNDIEYCFTDISRRFINLMKKQVKNKHLQNITCCQFDITKDCHSQSIKSDYYDIIIGLDVVHATPNVIEALNNLKPALNDNGFICLLETTQAQSWDHFIMGITKGWWLFNDDIRTFTPLLSCDSWRSVLLGSGFASPSIFSLGDNADSALILGAKTQQ